MNDGEYFFDTGIAALKPERFVKMVRNIGVDRVLFGTDSPWTDQLQSIESIRKSGLTNEEADKILGNPC